MAFRYYDAFGNPLEEEKYPTLKSPADVIGPQGVQVPTDESLSRAADAAFTNVGSNLSSNPTFGGLEWEDSAVPSALANSLGQPQQVQERNITPLEYALPVREQDDYGWGIKNAFMRGLIRSGQLVDLAQNDWEEFAEGEKAISKYGISKHDEERLAELQESDGFWDALGYYVKNPALAMQVVAESLPMSAPTIIGAGLGALAGPATAAAAGGAGSFVTEYLASLSEAMKEEGIDATNPAALREIFSDPEFMAKAREVAAKRGLGIAMFDALSVGIAGRMYTPAKALVGATKEGASATARTAGRVLGGTSEIIAQSGAGALGEATGQVFAGQEYDPVAIAGEAIGEVVPGLGEAAIGSFARREKTEAAPTPPDGTTPAERDVPDEPPPSLFEQERQAEDAEGAAATAEDVDKEAEDQIVEPPPPEKDQAETPKETPDKEAAPESQEGELSEEEIVAKMKAADEEIEAKEQERIEAKETPEEVTPLITIKDLGPKITKTFPKGKQSKPVRDAWRGVVKALKDRYPDVDLKVPAGSFTGTGLARFFKKLQEQVDITKDLPEVRELLTQISQQEEVSDVIHVLDRLASKIRDEAPSLATTAPDSVAGQAQAAYNKFTSWVEGKVSKSKAKGKEGTPTLKGTGKVKFATELGEFAAVVKNLVIEADRAGVLEMEGSGLSATYGRTLEAAAEAMDAAMAPQEKATKLKSGETGKKKVLEKFRADSLIGIADDVVAIAKNLIPKLAEKEAAVTKARSKKTKKKDSISEPVEKPSETKDLEAPTNDSGLNKQSVNKPKKESKKNKDLEKEKKSDVIKTDTTEKVTLSKGEKLQRAKAAKMLMDRLEKKGGATEDEWAALSVDIYQAGSPKALVARAEKLRKKLKVAAEVIPIEDALPPARQKAVETSKKKSAKKGPTINQLRTRAKELGVSAAGSKVAIAERIADAEKRARAEERMLAEADDNADKVYSGDDYVPHSDTLSPEDKAILRKLDQERKARAQATTKLVDEGAKPIDIARKARDLGYEIDALNVTELRKVVKALGGKYGKSRAEVLNNLDAAVNDTISAHERKIMAEEDAEILDNVKENMPKKYQKGHVYHTVRNISDVASIVKNGLKTGTNIALNMLGQGVSMLTDTGTVVLVFADKRNAYSIKDYQNDGVITETGMKPVAIIADDINEQEIATLSEAGLPVFVGGKQVAAKAAKVKVTVKKKKKIADPDKVLDPTQAITGHESRELRESVGAKTLDEAFEKAGVSKWAAKKVRGLMGLANKQQRQAITDAAYEFASKKDPIRFATRIQEILGATPSDDIVQAFTDFYLAINERTEERLARQQAEAEAEALSNEEILRDQYTKDEIEIMRTTGELPPDIDPDSTVVDEHNVSLAERLKEEFGLSPDNKTRNKVDDKILTRVVSKIQSVLDEHTRSAEAQELKAKYSKGDMNMQELIELFLQHMPKNHRYTHLLNLLKTLNLDFIKVELHEDVFAIDSSGTVGVFTNPGQHVKDSVIKLVQTGRNASDFVKTMLHEMVHAATVYAYHFDRLYKKHITTLWFDALEAYSKQDRAFPLGEIKALFDAGEMNAAQAEIKAFLKKQGRYEPRDAHGKLSVNYDDIRKEANENYRVFYGLVSPIEFIAEGFTNREFQRFLADTEIQNTEGLTNYLRIPKDFHSKPTNLLNRKVVSLMKAFMGGIKRMLGISRRNNVLEELIHASVKSFDSSISYGFYGRGPRESFIYKQDRSSRTGMVAAALRAKERVKNIQKRIDTDNEKASTLTDIHEQYDLITAAGKAQRSIWEAKELLDIGLEAIEDTKKDRSHVLQDHLERAEDYISRAESSLGIAQVNVEFKDETTADIPDKKVKSTVINDTAEANRGRDKIMRTGFQNLVQRLKDLPEKVNLGFMSRDQIERKYRKDFEWAAKQAGMEGRNPWTRYVKAKQKASVIAERYAQRAAKALRKVQKFDNKFRSKYFRLMHMVTTAQVWPDVSLRDAKNDHLWSEPDKKGVRKLDKHRGELAKKARKEWLALKRQNPEAADLLIEMANLTKRIQDQKRIEALVNVGKSYAKDESFIQKLASVESPEDIHKAFPEVYDKEGNILPVVKGKENRPDAYKYKKKDSKQQKADKDEAFEEWKDLVSIAEVAEAIVEGVGIKGPYFPLRRYGNFVIASTEEWNDNNEKYVSFHSSKAEADRVAAALKEKYGMDTYRTRKIESMVVSHDVESVVGSLIAKMNIKGSGMTAEGSQAMIQRVQGTMYQLMAENTAYASQLKRQDVDGVSYDDMGRAFEEYVYVSKFQIGDIATAHDIVQSMKDMYTATGQDVATVDKERTDRISMVRDELALQNQEDMQDRYVSPFQKAVGILGFFNFLGAPSYWVLNATQTLTVTLPYLGGKYGLKANGVYKDAAATIFKAASKAKSYEEFKANLPAEAQKVVAELEEQGIIQSTIAHEFGDMISPSTLTRMIEKTGVFGRATTTGLRIMEKVPETVEKYNRIVTGLAAYKLSDGSIVETADAVQATQFNYDSANRARLLKFAPQWAGGGLRAVITPVMMFKTYGVGLARLLYGNIAKGLVTGKTAAERSEARKIAGGLILSHSVYGGVAGGMMMAPVQLLVGAFNEAFREVGDEFDPEEAIELYLQDVANDAVAALVARGVPAAMGVDMSKSINLGNLLWLGNDRINLSDAGGVETAMATALGPVAQYAMTTAREGLRLMSGDPRGNWYDFAAAAVPLKMARGVIRGAKYEFEGVGTDTLTWLEPDEVSGWLRMAMGFRPTGEVMLMDYEYNQIARDTRRGDEKSRLINRALKADTSAKRAAVWQDIEDFNRSLPARKDRITKGDVVRLRSRRRSLQREYNRERR
jgi:hypothetical protein